MDTVKYRRNNHQHQHERIADKSLFFTKGEEIEKKIHKYYLVIALFFGVILSIWMPFFNEPDGVFHFVNSSNIVHLTTDINVYGEDSKWFGDQFANQKPAYQNGDYFKKYFETEVQKMPMSKLPRSTEYPKVLSYNFIGHLIPAIGVWAGYHIYPSMGMMIVCGRLVNMLVMTIGMFLIIKFVKRGKLLFMVVALSPVQMNLFSSLSYDATSMLLVSIFIASVINIVNRDKFTIFSLIRLCLLAAIIYLGAKTNLWLVFLFIPLLVFAYPLKKIIKSIIVLTPPIARRIFMIITIGILVAVADFYIAHQRGGFLTLIYKLFYLQFWRVRLFNIYFYLYKTVKWFKFENSYLFLCSMVFISGSSCLFRNQVCEKINYKLDSFSNICFKYFCFVCKLLKYWRLYR